VAQSIALIRNSASLPLAGSGCGAVVAPAFCPLVLLLQQCSAMVLSSRPQQTACSHFRVKGLGGT
jgi:hypothetical protein